MTPPVKCFVAYPSSPPARAEAIEKAVQNIQGGGIVDILSWKTLSVSGRVIVNVVCDEIRDRDVFIADVTGLNPNVLFELGYAIALRKRIWLLLDPSIERAKLAFERFQLLTTVGYTPYSSSVDITEGFFKDEPYKKLDQDIYSDLVQVQMGAKKKAGLLYLKCDITTEASIRVSQVVNGCHLPCIVDDPKEMRVQPLSWYVQQTTASEAVLCHLLSTDHSEWERHNSKHALVAGLAHGLDKHLLMLAHEPYVSPIDYRDLLKVHATATQALVFLNDWISPIAADYGNRVLEKETYKMETRAQGELRNIAIGDPIAEFEAGQLTEYFVSTAAYSEALRSKHSIFVGRKGTGKTATLYKLAEELAADPRNHVCVVKPVDYELQGLLDMLAQQLSKSEKGYLIESFWKFLIYTELAKSVFQTIIDKPVYYVRTEPESELCSFVGENKSVIMPEFSV